MCGQGVSGGSLVHTGVLEAWGSPLCRWLCAVVVGIGDGTNLGDGAVVGIGNVPIGGNVVDAMVCRDVVSIPCRVLMACLFPSPTTNMDADAGLLSASARSSTAWCAASVKKSFGTGQ